MHLVWRKYFTKSTIWYKKSSMRTFATMQNCAFSLCIKTLAQITYSFIFCSTTHCALLLCISCTQYEEVLTWCTSIPTSYHIQSTYFMHLAIKKARDFSKMIEYQRSYAGNCISILKQLGLYYTARRRYDGGCHAGQGRQAERPAEAAGPFRKWISFSSVVAS